MCEPLPVSPQVQTLIQELSATTDPLERQQIQARLCAIDDRQMIIAENGNHSVCPLLRPVSARLHLR